MFALFSSRNEITVGRSHAISTIYTKSSILTKHSINSVSMPIRVTILTQLPKIFKIQLFRVHNIQNFPSKWHHRRNDKDTQLIGLVELTIRIRYFTGPHYGLKNSLCSSTKYERPAPVAQLEYLLLNSHLQLGLQDHRR